MTFFERNWVGRKYTLKLFARVGVYTTIHLKHQVYGTLVYRSYEWWQLDRAQRDAEELAWFGKLKEKVTA